MCCLLYVYMYTGILTYLWNSTCVSESVDDASAYLNHSNLSDKTCKHTHSPFTIFETEAY